MNNKVSIGMPVYNDKDFLASAIESILNQTYVDFELIISDDCSSDGSSDICSSYARSDYRVSYIRQEKNIGISRNMEFLLSKAVGTYFMWAANDDLWDCEFVDILVKALEDRSEVISAFVPMHFIDEKGDVLTHPAPRHTDYSGTDSKVRLKKLIYTFDDSFGYGMFRRDQILDVEFPIWWWPNARCPYNNIYPTLCYYLSKGDFVLVGSRPMWFNRLKNRENVHHKVPFKNSLLLGLLALSMRKLNLVICSAKMILKGSDGNIVLLTPILPSMIYKWFLIPCWEELKISLLQLKKGEIRFI